MRIRFRNSAFAAAFVTAVLAQANKSDSIIVFEWPDTEELAEIDGAVTLVVDNEDKEDMEIYVEDHAVVDYSVMGIIDLNAVINRVVPPTPATGESLKANNVRGYDVVLFRNGNVHVGCKTFSGADVDRIIGVARRRKSGLTFQEFRTRPSNHRIWAADTEGNKPGIGIDNDGRITPEEVEQIAAARAEFLAKPAANPVPAYNFLG